MNEGSETDAEKIEKALSEVKKTLLPNGKWHVKGSLNMSNIKLTSLKDLNVEIVDGYFSCYNNKLTSLLGAPTKVGGYFVCSYNSLTSLEGAPKEVGGGFYCYKNSLTSLEGAPREVRGNFSCSTNQLTSLKGAPEKVGDDFKCFENPQLTSLEGAPKEVKGKLFTCDNKLKKTQEYRDLLKTYGMKEYQINF
jgi:hypothetical protein